MTTKKSFVNTLLSTGSKKSIFELTKEEFDDNYKTMQKNLRKIYMLAVKNYILFNKRFEDPVVERAYNKILYNYLIDYYESKMKEIE